MQGLVTKVSGAAYRAANIAIPPLPVLSVPTTLWAYLGTDLASSQNMIPGAPPITAVGSPAFLPNGNFISVGPTTSTLHGAGYLDTGVPDDSQSFTLVAVCRANGTSGSMIPLGNNDPGGSGFGISWQLQTAAAPGCVCSINGPAINLKLPAVSAAEQTFFKTYLVSYDDPTFTMDIYNLTDGTTVRQVGSSFARSRSATGTFLIGWNQRFTTGVANPADVAMVGKISGSVTAAQAQAIGANIRATEALTGMMV